MALIYTTANFTVESDEQPFVSRHDGGHVVIRAKDQTIGDRTQLTPVQAIELMRLTMVVGEALQTVMNNQGVPVVKVNYQDMGNWAFKEPGGKPHLHVHLFGRAQNAQAQIFPEAVFLPDRSSGFYDGFMPLTAADGAALRAYIVAAFQSEKFSDVAWGLACADRSTGQTV